MARQPSIKKEDLLSTALALFRKNGVDHTSVSDIVKELHIAQGSFYNYFRSKDDIFAAVLELVTENTIKEMRKTLNRTDINPIQKLNLLTIQDFRMNRHNDSLFDVLHESRYTSAHLQYIVSRINKLKPIYAELIRQGVKEGCFTTSYPDEAAQFLLTATKFVFDPAFFTYNREEMLRMARAVGDFYERVLGAAYNMQMLKEMEQNIATYWESEYHEN
ncbi:TetR/AcrR family transcriptional regulator [Clostridium luticellarii]|jgi:AcrR family transcriptional regulator|uniref:Putative HTH-type transcriptional regulator YvdT n=1 Tax=Clostridium luticellarii TaxID=1691940 RepID=A0A2T0BSF8_9CLOT|nr:TetR/AcrR family transcriptional regulator [Clostridium luticellarii]PRR86821.1 putative HTH-type transcriptional regulator YvdT [Clostridium luticellarii]